MSEPQIVYVPKLYENMGEAAVGPWHVTKGQQVERGEPLVELITDKTVEELEAPMSGQVLGIYAEEKSTVPIGYALAIIGEAGSPLPDVETDNKAKLAAHRTETVPEIDFDLGSKPPSNAAKSADSGSSADREGSASPAYRAAPAARTLAKKYGIDLGDVARGLCLEIVHRKDVEAYMQARQNEPERRHSGMETSSLMTVTGNLSGKVALITGASGAIGGAITRHLASRGAIAAVHCFANKAGADDVVSELRSNGAQADSFSEDLTSAESAEALVKAIYEKYTRIDILVNNAGTVDDALVGYMTDDQWKRVINVNLSAPFYVTRAVVMLMARQRHGRIINIVSDAGRMGAANRSNYAAAKEGLVGFTRAVARETASMGIRVNAVSPGFIDTGMMASMSEKRRQALLRDIPVRRFGKPEDVAEIVGFLSLPAAEYITGQVISVDGGLFMG